MLVIFGIIALKIKESTRCDFCLTRPPCRPAPGQHGRRCHKPRCHPFPLSSSASPPPTKLSDIKDNKCGASPFAPATAVGATPRSQREGGGVATVGASFGTDEAGRSGFGSPVPRSGDGGADDAASGLRKRPRRIWGGESNPLRPNGNEIDSTVAKSVACVALESRARAGGARRRRRGRRAWAVGGGGQFSYIINMYIL